MALTQWEVEQSINTGIYLPVKCTRYARSYTVLLGSKKICLTDKPIISFEDFESISPLQKWDNQVYFDIKFSRKAFEVIDKLSQSFPNAELAFIVDKQVFIVFKMDDKYVNQTFRFNANPNEIADFIIMHDRLVKLKH